MFMTDEISLKIDAYIFYLHAEANDTRSDQKVLRRNSYLR